MKKKETAKPECIIEADDLHADKTFKPWFAQLN